MWDALIFVVRLGLTPMLMRWYMVRKKVLEKIKQRDSTVEIIAASSF